MVSIELAATTIYVHYVVTIRITYKTTTVIRQYFYVTPAKQPVSLTYMGHKDQSSSFDPTLKESRVLTPLSTLELTPVTVPTYTAVLDSLNTQYKTSFKIINVVYVRYRVFPLGNYTKVTLKDEAVVGNLHLVSNNQPQTTEILNWHPV